jgi:hypothetical protein
MGKPGMAGAIQASLMRQFAFGIARASRSTADLLSQQRFIRSRKPGAWMAGRYWSKDAAFAKGLILITLARFTGWPFSLS